MTTVLLAINAKHIHTSLPVWLLSGSVSRYAKKPHDVRIVEANINQSNDEIASQVTACNPDVVGISTYIWNAAMLPSLIEMLREMLPAATIVLGGPEATHNAEFWLGCGADYVVRGEGEKTFPALLDELSVNGNGSGTRMSPVIDSVAVPPEDFIDPYNDDYFTKLNGRLAYIETSRGCPFNCAFCLSGACDKGTVPLSPTVRYLPVTTAIEQLLRLSLSNAKTIKLVDRTFNCNPERAYELFEFVINLDTTACFHFEVAPDLFDERTLSLLQTAPTGRIQLEAGIQSFHEPALKAVLRIVNLRKAEENIQALLQNGNIHIHIDLIAGLPYETLSDLIESFNRAYALGAHTLQLGFLKLLHGSALRKKAGTLGILYDENPPYEITSSPWLTPEDLATIKHAENALQHTYNKGRFLNTLQYAMEATNQSPFQLYKKLGEACPNHATPLETYAEQILGCLATLRGVEQNELKSRMICDLLAMTKGGVMLPALKHIDKRRHTQLIIDAEKQLGHTVTRNEAAILPSGDAVYVDSQDRDPVTELYALHKLTASDKT